MTFVKIQNEDVVQVNDKTRIDISKSFTNGVDTLDLFEIDPDNSGTFYDVTSNKYLDWQYALNGDTVVVARITDSATNVFTEQVVIKVLSVSEDNLFSNDKDIISYENDLLNWVQAGRDSFLDKHRAAQKEILNELDSKRIWKRDGTRYVAADILDIQEFKDWSKFVTLRIIFENISNDVNDVFSEKASRYSSLATKAMSRASLRLDYNQDGVIESNEKTDIQSGTLRRC